MTTTPTDNNRVPLEALPPISMDLFLQQSGLSPATAWRYRKKGWIKTITIAGRHYVSRKAIAEFNQRAARGEFAGTIQNPSTRSSASPNDDRIQSGRKRN